MVLYRPILFNEPMFRPRIEMKRDYPSGPSNLLLRSAHIPNRLPLIIGREMSQKGCASFGEIYRVTPVKDDNCSNSFRLQRAQQQRPGCSHGETYDADLASRYWGGPTVGSRRRPGRSALFCHWRFLTGVPSPRLRMLRERHRGDLPLMRETLEKLACWRSF